MKTRAPDSLLANSVLLDFSFIKARVKAVYRNDFLKLDWLLLSRPVQNRVVMNAKIIAHPENDTMHLVLVQV